jgi:hypothetical protein
MRTNTPPSHAHRHERHNEVVVYEMNRIQLNLIFGFKVKKDFLKYKIFSFSTIQASLLDFQ